MASIVRLVRAPFHMFANALVVLAGQVELVVLVL